MRLIEKIIALILLVILISFALAVIVGTIGLSLFGGLVIGLVSLARYFVHKVKENSVTKRQTIENRQLGHGKVTNQDIAVSVFEKLKENKEKAYEELVVTEDDYKLFTDNSLGSIYNLMYTDLNNKILMENNKEKLMQLKNQLAFVSFKRQDELQKQLSKRYR